MKRRFAERVRSDRQEFKRTMPFRIVGATYQLATGPDGALCRQSISYAEELRPVDAAA